MWLLAVLPLGGCVHSTTSAMREEPPQFTASSQRSVNDIAACVTAIWERDGNVSFLPRPHGGSVSLAMPAMYRNLILALVDIDDEGSSRRVTYRSFQSMWAKANRNATEKARACL